MIQRCKAVYGWLIIKLLITAVSRVQGAYHPWPSVVRLSRAQSRVLVYFRQITVQMINSVQHNNANHHHQQRTTPRALRMCVHADSIPHALICSNWVYSENPTWKRRGLWQLNRSTPLHRPQTMFKYWTEWPGHWSHSFWSLIVTWWGWHWHWWPAQCV